MSYTNEEQHQMNTEELQEAHDSLEVRAVDTAPQQLETVPETNVQTFVKPERTNALLMQDVIGLCKGRDRSKRYELFLEIIPNWCIIVILSVVILLTIGVVAIAIFASPTGINVDTKRFDNNMEAVYNGSQPIVHEITGISPNNLAFIFSLTFQYNRTYVGILKDNLQLLVMLQSRNGPNEEWRNLTSGLVEQVRSLTCVQDASYYFVGSSLFRYVSDCNSINIFYERYIHSNNYRATIYVLNLQEVYKRGLLTGAIATAYTYTTDRYTAFELGFRIVFCILTALQLITFFFIIVRAQWLKKWHTSQKWLLVLLFLQIFFHDPIFFGQAFVGFFLFPLLSVIFTLTFTFTFLLYLLIFFHSLFKRPSERTFCSFYMTKVIVVVPIYIITVVLFTWSRLYNFSDSAYGSISDVPGYLYLEAIVVILLIVYVVALLYYIFRAIGAASQRKINRKFSARFKVMGSFSFLVLLALTGVTVARDVFRQNSPGLTFLVTHFIIWIYFALLTLFFLPSSREVIVVDFPIKPITTEQPHADTTMSAEEAAVMQTPPASPDSNDEIAMREVSLNEGEEHRDEQQ